MRSDQTLPELYCKALTSLSVTEATVAKRYRAAGHRLQRASSGLHSIPTIRHHSHKKIVLVDSGNQNVLVEPCAKDAQSHVLPTRSLLAPWLHQVAYQKTVAV